MEFRGKGQGRGNEGGREGRGKLLHQRRDAAGENPISRWSGVRGKSRRSPEFSGEERPRPVSLSGEIPSDRLRLGEERENWGKSLASV